MESELYYKEKYLKYKQKYLNLRDQSGGVAFTAGKYIFFFSSSVLGQNTPLLNHIETHGNIPKPDFNKITDEISKNSEGWYYRKTIKGASDEISKIVSTLSIVKKVSSAAASTVANKARSTAVGAYNLGRSGVKTSVGLVSSAASSAGKKIGEMKASYDEKSRIALCKKCQEAKCPLANQQTVTELEGGFCENCFELIGGSTSSSIKLEKALMDKTKKSKDLSEEDIINGLKELLVSQGAVIDRAIVCDIALGITSSSKIVKYVKF